MKNKKRVLTLVLAGVLILGFGLPVLAIKGEEPTRKEFSFTDLEKDKWYTESIIDLVEKGILKGFNEQIKPNANLTRAEYAQILHNIINFDGIINLENTSDVKESDWFFEAVRGATAHGVLRGDGGMLLRPNDPLTREEMFVMTVRAFELEDLKSSVTKDYIKEYNDAKDVGQWAKESMNILLDQKLIKGNEENKLLPKKNITRAEASMVISAMEKVKDLESSMTVSIKPIEKPNKPQVEPISPNFSGNGPIFPVEYYPPKYPENLPEGLTLSSQLMDTPVEDFDLPGFPKKYVLFENFYSISGQKLSGKGSLNNIGILYTIEDDNTNSAVIYMTGKDSVGDGFFYTYSIRRDNTTYDWRKPAFTNEDFEAADNFALSFLEAFKPYLDKLPY